MAPFGFVRVGAAGPRLRVADPEYNVTEVLALAGEARRRGVQALVFPELALTGYSAGDLFFSLSTLVGGAERALARLLRETADNPAVIVVGLPVTVDSQLFNAAAVIQTGRLLGVVPKSYLPGYKEYYEERWFSSAREALRAEVRLAGQEAPFGTDLLFAARVGAWVHPRGRDLRGPLGAHPSEQPPRHRRGHDPPEPVGLGGLRRQGRLQA